MTRIWLNVVVFRDLSSPGVALEDDTTQRLGGRETTESKLVTVLVRKLTVDSRGSPSTGNYLSEKRREDNIEI